MLVTERLVISIAGSAATVHFVVGIRPNDILDTICKESSATSMQHRDVEILLGSKALAHEKTTTMST